MTREFISISTTNKQCQHVCNYAREKKRADQLTISGYGAITKQISQTYLSVRHITIHGFIRFTVRCVVYVRVVRILRVITWCQWLKFLWEHSKMTNN